MKTFNTEALLKTWGDEIVKRLRESIVANDMFVTGKTHDSVRAVVKNKVLTILAAEHIQNLETGVPSGTLPDLRDLENWIEERGLNLSARSVQQNIFESGSLLFQGKDRRFTGQQSGVLTDVINPELTEEISNAFSNLVLDQVSTTLKNEFGQSINI